MNIDLYKEAVKIIEDIKQIENSIEIIEQGLNDGSVKGRILLRTDEVVFCSYRYANVRPTSYVAFLNGELKDHKKDLKVIEAQIKSSIK